jgi:carbon-monoxide dehydrogenase large subunit
VKWIEDRQENFTASFHGHEARVTVRGAFAPDGELLGVDADIACDVGAYSAAPMTCAVEPMMAARELPGVYRFGHYRARTRGVATNKAPMAPYRGVARPQVVFAMERMMDKAAAPLGITRADVRRRNLIADDEFPYRGPNGELYDRGSYLESLERCLEALGWDDWPQRQERARAEGRLLGLGVATFSESTGFGTMSFGQRGMRATPGYETAEVRMEPTGDVVVAVGVSAHGQGHKTTLAQVVADELGIDMAAVRVVQSDTDLPAYGWGTFASRSAVVGGGACKRAAGGLRDKLVRLAADQLEASPEDVELADGRAGVRGAPAKAIPIEDLAHLAYHAAHKLPAGEEPGLAARATFDPPGTFSNATHGAIVEVDRDTGEVSIDRYVVVEDCGTMLNPLIIDGQVTGGVAQGIAKALYEQIVYDEDGQCKTASYMDYLLPTVAEVPAIEIQHLETPSEHSETGAKGMGEGGTIGAPACLANAVSDALAHLGTQCDALPITPESLWAAVRVGSAP